MRTAIILLCAGYCIGIASSEGCAEEQAKFVEMPAERLEDKIRGGMLGQIIGNLNGLPHEFKYIGEPGNVKAFTPSLPDGARTDDDTDLEWVYLRGISFSRQSRLPPHEISSLWKAHINRRIWCANLYARQLMDLGIEPPWTGNAALNPWSEFNISGQFICESFGLMAPAMPQTAARIGLNYTHVTIDGEPAQTTQLFTTMIAMAFVEEDIERLLDAGVAAVDPLSEIAEVVAEVRRLHRFHPDDWRITRQAIKDRWQTRGGITRESNGYELNTACTIAALLYGKGDLVETLRIAFNFGWDCDNNAATAATILGVIRGRKSIDDEGWAIADIYKNTTRDNLPEDETITGLENTLIECARIVIEEQSGQVTELDSQQVYRIRTEPPSNIEPLRTVEEQLAVARKHWLPIIETELTEPGQLGARAAYVAICLGEAEQLKTAMPDAWAAAVKELAKYPQVVRELFIAPEPAGKPLRKKAQRAGLRPPNRD